MTFLLLVWFSVSACGQSSVPDSLATLFYQQLLVFPQEKIHLHTDKPYYISGERIWFRAYLMDAASHLPAIASRYVYTELLNPLDSVVVRVKTRQEESYNGHLLIPDDAPEGDYTIRAYTTFMRSQEEHYFFTKTIRIGDPQASLIHTKTDFIFESNRRVNATFRFSNVSLSTPLVPKSVKISVNGGKLMNLSPEDDGTARVSFNLSAASRQRIILLEIVEFGNPYRQFIQIPTPDNDFDVGFYPEGGSLMEGVVCKVAFKAMKSNGQSTFVSGAVYEQSGTEIGKIQSDFLGMGSFLFVAEKGKTYYAVCENNKGESKRFPLPAAVADGYALTVSHPREKIYASVLQPAATAHREELYLLAHTRGLVHFVIPWNHETNLAVIPKDQFPSGVLHLVLFDSGRNPVSERLVFINNQDQTEVVWQPEKENYDARSLVKNRVTVTDGEGEPLSGSFSVSVTSDKEITPDSTSNILTQLLLVSDLRGNIENPGYYFLNDNTSSLALDLLMCTQGWRRYNIAELAQGRFSRPSSPIEVGHEISGTVRNAFPGKPLKNIGVNVISLTGGYFDNTKTDSDGRFYFRGGEFPDDTRFMVSAIQGNGTARMELILDRETFPERKLHSVASAAIDSYQFAKYADKAEQQYISEGGIREYVLSEVTIVGQKAPLRTSPFYDTPHITITQEKLDEVSVKYSLSGLLGIGGVNLRHSEYVPLLVIDGFTIAPEEAGAYLGFPGILNPHDIEQIDILKDAGSTAMWGSRGAGGVIVVYTKRGKANPIEPPLHVKSVLPLGYQNPVEFYAPKYDTPAARNAQSPDLRTTIHWQPVVQADSVGMASFEFYTADETTSYTVIIEGLTDDGHIIRKEGKLWRRDE